MTKEEEREYLKQISPDSLPLDTRESGYSAEEIRKHFTRPLFFLLELLQEYRDLQGGGESELSQKIATIENNISKILTGDLIAKKAETDSAGENIVGKYETKADATAKLNTAKTYATTNCIKLRNGIVVYNNLTTLNSELSNYQDGQLFLVLTTTQCNLNKKVGNLLSPVFDFTQVLSDLTTLSTAIDTKVAALRTELTTAINAVNDRLNNANKIGRFLSLWNAATGSPTTPPPTNVYECQTGDFFIISALPATGNIIFPTGSVFNNKVVPTVFYEGTTELAKGDFIMYDGEEWIVRSMGGQITAFGDIVGDPTDNEALAEILAGLQSKLSAAQIAAINSVSSKSTVTVAADGKSITVDGVTHYLYTPDLSLYLTAATASSTYATKTELVSYRTAAEQDAIDATFALASTFASYRTAANQDAIDNAIKSRLDNIENKSDVVDIVADEDELAAYVTTNLNDGDIIKVLKDGTKNDAITHYKWLKTLSSWKFIGSIGPYYTTSEVDSKFALYYTAAQADAKFATIAALSALTEVVNGKASTTYVDNAVANLVSQADLNAALTDVVTKTYVDNKIDQMILAQINGDF